MRTIYFSATIDIYSFPCRMRLSGLLALVLSGNIVTIIFHWFTASRVFWCLEVYDTAVHEFWATKIPS